MTDAWTLAIGGLSTLFTPEAGAAAACGWDEAHQAFVVPGEPPLSESLAARLRLRTGEAPADHTYSQSLAASHLWTLHLNPTTRARRITLYGCPAGTLAMTLDIAAPSSVEREADPLEGILYLGPPPERCSYVPLGYPLTPLLWTLLLSRSPLAIGGLLCHACGVKTPSGEGILFMGFSGGGKSTTSRLWRAACPGATILSDDRIVLRRDPASPSGFMLYGTPWHGDAREADPRGAPLRRVFILGRSADTVTSRQVPLSPSLAAAQLLARTTPPIWETTGTSAALALAGDVCQAVPVARWDFAPNAQAIRDLLQPR